MYLKERSYSVPQLPNHPLDNQEVAIRKHNPYKLPKVIHKYIIEQAKKNSGGASKDQYRRPQAFSKGKGVKNMRMKTCQICGCEAGQKNFQSIGMCDHTYCTSCLHQYVIYKVGVFESIECPNEECREGLDEQGEMFLELPLDIRQKYKKLQQYNMIMKSGNKRMCPNEDCDGILYLDEHDPINPVCPLCKTAFCSKCFFKQHEGECQQYQLAFFQNTLHYRQCARCSNIIEKASGCNHMTCHCGYQFCYLCGKRWNPSHKCQDELQCQMCCLRCEWVECCEGWDNYFQQCEGCECEPGGLCWWLGRVGFFLFWLLLFVPFYYLWVAIVFLTELIGGVFMGLMAAPCLLLENGDIQWVHVAIGLIFLPFTVLLLIGIGIKMVMCDREETSQDILCFPCHFLTQAIER